MLCLFLKKALNYLFYLFFPGFEDAKHKEDIYFEIVEPETLHYTFKVRPAQDFGVPFVSMTSPISEL